MIPWGLIGSSKLETMGATLGRNYVLKIGLMPLYLSPEGGGAQGPGDASER